MVLTVAKTQTVLLRWGGISVKLVNTYDMDSHRARHRSVRD
jgi:hypothetical protein